MTGAALGAPGATRRVGPDGTERLFFGGCSYLGLSHDPRVLGAARSALERYGAGSGAARGTTGTFDVHLELEAELATFAGAPDCALLPDAALADLAVGLALLEPGQRVLCDPDAHPCITDAVRAAGARVVFADEDALDQARSEGCTAAFTDGTFPTAARTAPLERLAALGLERVVVDDAHGFGLLGERGAGAAERLDLAGGGAVLVVALSKCLGASGGAVLGPRALVDAVRRTSPYACTTAPPPPAVAAARAALAIVRDEPQRRARVLARAERLHRIVDAVDPAPPRRAVPFPVRALALEDEARTRDLERALLARGIEAPLVRYPGGPTDTYLRLVVGSEHTDADLDRLEDALLAATGH